MVMILVEAVVEVEVVVTTVEDLPRVQEKDQEIMTVRMIRIREKRKGKTRRGMTIPRLIHQMMERKAMKMTHHQTKSRMKTKEN